MNITAHIDNPTDVDVNKQTLAQLLQLNLILPPYQRRYCWGEPQVAALLGDIDSLLQDKGGEEPQYQVPLFLGTVILHQEGDVKLRNNLVDGQQRALTLSLLLIALHRYNNRLNNGIDVYQLAGIEQPSLLNARFSHHQAQQQLALNFKQIEQHINNAAWANNQAKLTQMLAGIECVVITIHSIDQAFAFFDSQNSSGKRLSEFDLLKARHLRGIVSHPSVGIGCSRIWEEYELLKLNSCHDYSVAYYLTEQLLGYTRQRQRGKPVDALQLDAEYPVSTQSITASATHQHTPTVALSGLTNSPFCRDWQVKYDADKRDRFPFTFTHQLSLHGEQLSRDVEDVSLLPLQLNQPLIGGEQFFIFIAKYVALYKQLFAADINTQSATDNGEVVSIQERYLLLHRGLEARQGLGYPRLIQVWQSLVIFYVDRFGQDKHLDTFVQLSDQYVFSLRIAMARLSRASVEKSLRSDELFLSFAQLATSSQAINLLQKLVEKRSTDQVLNDRLMAGIKGISANYIKLFYWHEDKNSNALRYPDNGLTRLLLKHKKRESPSE